MTIAIIGILGILLGALMAHIALATLTERRLAQAVCPYCAHPYPPVQWSAFLALVTGHGRCEQCGRRFRWSRLAGELFLALSWVLLVTRFGLNERVLFSMVAIIPLAMIMVTDLAAKRVPNRIILPSIGVMTVLGALLGPALPSLKSVEWWNAPLGAAAGFLILRILVWVGVAVFGEGAMGEGDITLSTYVGATVGIPLVIESLLLGFVLGGIGAVLLLVTRRATMRTAIPYGPFIILGCVVTLVWGPDILRWFLY